MEDRVEILKALETIQSVCKSHAYCSDCPFSKDGYCEIASTDPESWKIRHSEVKWRAFED